MTKRSCSPGQNARPIGSRSISISTISPAESFSIRSKVCAGTSSVDSASSRWRAETRNRPSDPL